jgi:hypothetical protein
VCLQASFVVCKRLRTVEHDAGSKDASDPKTQSE